MTESKQKIAKKFIDLLQFEGWNQNTLEKAAKEAGFETGYVNIIYPGGISEWTAEFVHSCDDDAFTKAKEAGLDKLRTTQKVEEIIYQRIKQYHFKLGNLEAVKKFAAYSSNPLNLAGSLRNIYDFSSQTWYEIGDKSTDFSYYTKRLSLGAIYTKSMLYSLSDKSDNLEGTKKFIQKSIDGLMKINKLKQKMKDIISYIPINKRA
jgi:ubiquinone biosynthesis protein COQ9